MAEMERERKRARSLKIQAGNDFTRIVVETVAYLTIITNDINHVDGQPSIQSMRAALKPAYEIIAESLGEFLKLKLQPSDLSGLQVDMMPGLGVWKFCVYHLQSDGKLQPYNVHVSAQDGLNTFLRLRARDGIETAQAIYDQI